MHCGYFDITQKDNQSAFLVGDAPFRLKFALKLAHPFQKRRFRQISAYNVSNIRDSEKGSTRRVAINYPVKLPRTAARPVDNTQLSRHIFSRQKGVEQ